MFTVKTLKILLVEDNLTIARQLTKSLQQRGWEMDYAQTGALAVTLVEANIYDVVILDLNLPDLDGLEVCARIKAQCEINTPVLMLTARDALDDKARGFGQGADDYVTKPFDLVEVALRCEALARRNDLHRRRKLELAQLTIDLAQKMAWREGNPLQLTAIGFTLLVQLAEASPNPVSRSVLMHKIWGDSPPDSDALKSHIYSLRTALDKPFAYPMLKTITNVGYKLQGIDD